MIAFNVEINGACDDVDDESWIVFDYVETDVFTSGKKVKFWNADVTERL